MRLFGRDREAERAEERELRCEACGYLLGSIGDLERCPECGRDAALSDPARRSGSAYQRRGGLGALAAAGAALIWRPRAFWDRVRVDGPTGLRLAVWHAALAGLIAASPLALYTRELGGWLLLATLAIGSGTLVFALTLVEWAGIRFWGRVHGFRVTRAVAWTICGHAGAGWVLGAALAAVGWVIGQAISESDYRAFDFGGASALAPIAAPVLIAVGGAFGLVAFETLTYLGVRRLRFANAPDAGGADQLSSCSAAGAGLDSTGASAESR
jgi:hypothetical protein